MSVQYAITTGSTALVAATAKTIIEGSVDGTGPPPEWIGFDITLNGVNAGAVPVLVELCTYSASGTGSAYTPKKLGAALGTARSSWKINDTVEPAGATVLAAWFVPPTGGLILQFPLGREILHPLSTVQGLRVTAPAVVNYVSNLYIEE